MNAKPPAICAVSTQAPRIYRHRDTNQRVHLAEHTWTADEGPIVVTVDLSTGQVARHPTSEFFAVWDAESHRHARPASSASGQ